MYIDSLQNTTTDLIQTPRPDGEPDACAEGGSGVDWWGARRPYRRNGVGLVYNPITHRRSKFKYNYGPVVETLNADTEQIIREQAVTIRPQNKARTKVYLYSNLVEFKPSQASYQPSSKPDVVEPPVDDAQLNHMRIENALDAEYQMFAYFGGAYARYLAVSGQWAALDSISFNPQPTDFEKENGHLEAPPKPKRGRITSFSDKSRRRLMKKINKASFTNDGGYFATLTYPSEWSIDWTVWKRDLDTILKRIKRLAKKHEIDLRYVWKLEFQRRGAPHFHFMLFGFPPEFARKFMFWLSLAWYEVVGSGDENHLKAGANVSLMVNSAMVGRYVGKYLSKLEVSIPEYTGRFWGTSSDWEMEYIVLLVKDWQALKLRRLIQKFLKKKGAHHYAKRLSHLRSFFVAGIGYDSDLMLRALANTTII